VLFGAADPGGRLPVTFPISEGQLPLAYDHLPTGRGDDYVDETGEPRFPFGFGLSYTTFAYSALQVVPDTIGPDGSVQVACRVSNTGTRPGDEVVQLYVHDELASVARPVMQLAGFTRIRLAPGETKVVSFRLDPSQLAPPGAPAPEPGGFRVMVGASSRDIRLSGHLEVR
jgi:beta-glucosidase